MTDEEFQARYEALKADVLAAYDKHASGVPYDARGLRGALAAALTSTAAKLIARDLGAEQCHAIFAAMGEFHAQALAALRTPKGQVH